MRHDQNDPSFLDHLEPRKLLSASLDGGGSLEIHGTAGDDAIVVEATDIDGQVRVSGVESVEDGSIFDGVRRIRVRLGQGDDGASFVGSFTNERGRVMPIRVFGNAGDDDIDGGDARNRIIGGGGDDVLDGGARADVIRGRAGDDVIHGNGGPDRLRGDAGRDTINGNDGNDRLKGGRGDDALYGDDGRDRLAGGAGTDMLRGGAGDDWLNGNAGSDDLYGDDGSDDFRGRRDESRDDDDSDRHGSDDDGTDDRGGGNDDDGTDDRGGGNDDDGTDDRGGDDGEHVGFDDDFVFLLRQIETNLGALPQEMIDLVNAAHELNAVAGPAMHRADNAIKDLFTDDRLEFLVNDDPPEDAGDAIAEALERLFGGDDGVRDFDRDGDLLDFDDVVTSYDILLGELTEDQGRTLRAARDALAANEARSDAVEAAFERLLAADLSDAFWSTVRTSVR